MGCDDCVVGVVASKPEVWIRSPVEIDIYTSKEVASIGLKLVVLVALGSELFHTNSVPLFLSKM